MRIDRRNVRRRFTKAMIEGDEAVLDLVYAYLASQGWAGGISVEDAITAVEQ